MVNQFLHDFEQFFWAVGRLPVEWVDDFFGPICVILVTFGTILGDFGVFSEPEFGKRICPLPSSTSMSPILDGRCGSEALQGDFVATPSPILPDTILTLFWYHFGSIFGPFSGVLRSFFFGGFGGFNAKLSKMMQKKAKTPVIMPNAPKNGPKICPFFTCKTRVLLKRNDVSTYESLQ